MMLMRTLLRFLDDDGGIDVCFEEAIADAGEWPEVSLQFDGCWFTECFLTFVIIRAQDSVFHQLNKLKEINSLTKESNLLNSPRKALEYLSIEDALLILSHF